MNYQLLYEKLIKHAKQQLPPDEYTESHHIIPKCMDGDDSQDNIVVLTARQHFVAHWILTKVYPTNYKLRYAFHMMFFPTSSGTRNTGWHLSKSRTYEYHKKELALLQSERLRGVLKSDDHKEKLRQAAYARWQDPDEITKQSERMKGNTNGLGAKRSPLTEEVKQKISAANKEYYKSHPGVNLGKTPSEETRKRISETKRNNPYRHSSEIIKRIADKHRGKKQTEHQKKRATEVNSATWEVITPSGEVLVITNLPQYCLEHKLSQGNLTVYGHTKGYRVRKIS